MSNDCNLLFYRKQHNRLKVLTFRLASLLLCGHCGQTDRFPLIFIYSSVPNRCVGGNKRAGGKILKKNIKLAGQNRRVGDFILVNQINVQVVCN